MPESKTLTAHQASNGRNDIFMRLANGLQKLTEGASPSVGADCIIHAKLAQALLREHGIETTIAVGEAAWRTGPGDQDVIVHSPQISGFDFGPGMPLPIHVWLHTTEGEILDFTTHSLRIKAAMLDASDGGHTAVQWCPPYLLTRPPGNTLNAVTMAMDSGVFHYHEFPGLLGHLNARGIGVGEADPGDLAVLRMLFHNERIHFMGHNSLMELSAISDGSPL